MDVTPEMKRIMQKQGLSPGKLKIVCVSTPYKQNYTFKYKLGLFNTITITRTYYDYIDMLQWFPTTITIIQGDILRRCGRS